MLERAVEAHLVRRVRAAGGLALKWVSPSLVGVPDRVLLLPGGRVVFVEVKRPGSGRLSAAQQRVIRLLHGLGVEAYVIYSKVEADELLSEVVPATGS